jgi:hypothetical protein
MADSHATLAPHGVPEKEWDTANGHFEKGSLYFHLQNWILKGKASIATGFPYLTKLNATSWNTIKLYLYHGTKVREATLRKGYCKANWINKRLKGLRIR